MEKEVIVDFTAGLLPIPHEIQAMLGLCEGTQVALRVVDGELTAHPLSPQPLEIEKTLAAIEQLRGMFPDERHEQRKWADSLTPQSASEADLDALAGSLPALRGAVEELACERSQHKW